MVKWYSGLLTAVVVTMMAGCSQTATKSPAVADNIRKSLDDAGLKTVSVSQDRTNGVITLNGRVTTDAAKEQAESIAKTLATGQVVADQVQVVPERAAADTKSMYSDLDKGIDNNLAAAFIQNRVPGTLHHSVKNGVVTLTGTVNSQNARAQAQQVAAGVPNVQQVVNELQVKDQKASSTK
ncbi:MAG: BON domain-containing protein [Bryobacteraceae bacterium]